jgi:DHA1 family bicyclomycin/chloramphenicol resistance-like MFS transporter
VTAQPTPPLSRRLLLVLILATALGPLAMQIFLPALPMIQDEFAVSSATAQLTLSLSAFSIAVAMLAFGPLSDRFGRRPTMIGGVVVYLLGSIVCAVAFSIGTLILGRIVQAAGGCAGLVLTRAIIRDLYDRDRSATMLAYVTMAMVTAPMLAPAIGGVLTDFTGWRSVFVFGGILGLVVALIVVRELPETAASPDLAGAGSRHALLRLMTMRPFWAYALCLSFSIGVFFCFLAGAPFLMVRVLGRPASEYGLLFILISGAFMLGNFAAARFSLRVGLNRMIVLGSIGSLAGTLILLALVMAGIWTPWSLFLPTSLGAFSQGLALPNAQAAAISVDPRAAGAASGLSGFLQMGLAGLAAQIVGTLENGTPYPMVIGMTFCAVISLLWALAAATGRRAHG